MKTVIRWAVAFEPRNDDDPDALALCGNGSQDDGDDNPFLWERKRDAAQYAKDMAEDYTDTKYYPVRVTIELPGVIK